MEDALCREYDLKELLKSGVHGKYAERYRAGVNLPRQIPDLKRESQSYDFSPRAKGKTHNHDRLEHLAHGPNPNLQSLISNFHPHCKLATCTLVGTLPPCP